MDFLYEMETLEGSVLGSEWVGRNGRKKGSTAYVVLVYRERERERAQGIISR